MTPTRETTAITPGQPESRSPGRLRGATAPWPARPLRRVAALLCIACAALVTGCGPKLVQPSVLVAPYDTTTLFAVAPPLNESGVSIVDPVRIAEIITGECEQVEGLRTVSTTRVLMMMRQLGLESVSTRGEAVALMNALGVDGLLIGSVSAWDPYQPLVLGMALELYRRDVPAGASVDPRSLRMETGASASASRRPVDQPVAQASGYFDSANHSVLQALAVYSTGRAEPESAFGRDIYLYSMEPYTGFVAHQLLADLMNAERRRLGVPLPEGTASTTTTAAPAAPAADDHRNPPVQNSLW